MDLIDLSSRKIGMLSIGLCIISSLLLVGCSSGEPEKEVIEVPVEVVKEVEVEKIVEVPVEVEKIVEVEKAVDVFEYSRVPKYKESPYVEINEGIPYFGSEILSSIKGEYYAELDDLGRCGAAITLLGEETMPTDTRGQIGDARPSGWQIIKYEGIDGNYLYNRCHLIGWQLSGENDNVRNLITGTRYLNVQGMEPFENEVADYIRETGNHVMYRATPVFVGEELVARGVLLEAQSIEDDKLQFNVFCYNVQPDVEIDYKTGESKSTKMTEDDEKEEKSSFSLNDFGGAASIEEQVPDRSLPADNSSAAVETSPQENVVAPVEPQAKEEPAPEPATESYVGNKNSMKFHYSWCASVKKMANHNKVSLSGTRDEIVGRGYEPCKNCNP